ncbi:MAG: hypothetical protein F6K65_31455 [Moorea sp. SIO3C2]|nr:hypothetical protein [Moorena sp. SIO3C2]
MRYTLFFTSSLFRYPSSVRVRLWREAQRNQARVSGGNPRVKALPPQDRAASPRPRCITATSSLKTRNLTSQVVEFL